MKITVNEEENALLKDTRRLLDCVVSEENKGSIAEGDLLRCFQRHAHQASRLIQKQGAENTNEGVVLLALEIEKLGESGYRKLGTLRGAFVRATQMIRILPLIPEQEPPGQNPFKSFSGLHR
jgi:hypothetical protein